jgi:hypothetical protein
MSAAAGGTPPQPDQSERGAAGHGAATRIAMAVSEYERRDHQPESHADLRRRRQALSERSGGRLRKRQRRLVFAGVVSQLRFARGDVALAALEPGLARGQPRFSLVQILFSHRHLRSAVRSRVRVLPITMSRSAITVSCLTGGCHEADR